MVSSVREERKRRISEKLGILYLLLSSFKLIIETITLDTSCERQKSLRQDTTISL